jgi:hypothetical protein
MLSLQGCQCRYRWNEKWKPVKYVTKQKTESRICLLRAACCSEEMWEQSLENLGCNLAHYVSVWHISHNLLAVNICPSVPYRYTENSDCTHVWANSHHAFLFCRVRVYCLCVCGTLTWICVGNTEHNNHVSKSQQLIATAHGGTQCTDSILMNLYWCA